MWRKFWVDTDPIPNTPENEALEQYFTRVAIANERFREEGAGQGWRSDRGEVLITLGPPDQELETPPGQDTRYVQWTYSEYRAVLTFQGQLGFSRLRLTPNSRSEFARVRQIARQRLREPELRTATWQLPIAHAIQRVERSESAGHRVPVAQICHGNGQICLAVYVFPVPRLYLIDGYALIYRAFYALISRPLRTSRGENTSAAWGVANFLLRLRSQVPSRLRHLDQ